MATDTPRFALPGRNTPLPAWILCGALLVSSVGAVFLSRALSRERAAHQLIEQSAAAQSEFVTQIESAISGLVRAVRGSAPGLGLVTATPSGARFIVASPGSPLLPAGTDLSTFPTLEIAARQARDRGLSQVVAVRRPGEPGQALVVIAAFPGGVAPFTTETRRRTLVAVKIGTLDIERLAGGAFRLLPGNVQIRLGDAVLYGVLPARETVVFRSSMAAGPKQWTVTAARALPGVPGLAWLWVAAALAASAITLGGGTARSRQITRAEFVAAHRSDETALIAETSRSLQSTLDLSATIPTVAVRLTDALRLDSLSISVTNPLGVTSHVFSYGRQAGGKIGSIPLEREGRSVGVLTYSCSECSANDADVTLQAVAGTIAAALANGAAYQAERATRERLEQIDAIKSDFFATISHEIKTPLVSILGFAELLESSWDQFDEDTVRDSISRISNNAASLSAMLQQVMDFSRIERTKLTVVPCDLDLVSSVRDVIARSAPLMQKHVVEIAAPPSCVILGDSQWVDRIVGNLLTNAAKFSPPGSRILISVVPEERAVRLVVDDEGPGVLPEERNSIFTRFFRGSSDIAHRTRGAGIGLAVVSELVRELGGAVFVDDAPTGGARFVVSFLRHPPGEKGQSLEPPFLEGGRRDKAS